MGKGWSFLNIANKKWIYDKDRHVNMAVFVL